MEDWVRVRERERERERNRIRGVREREGLSNMLKRVEWLPQAMVPKIFVSSPIFPDFEIPEFFCNSSLTFSAYFSPYFFWLLNNRKSNPSFFFFFHNFPGCKQSLKYTASGNVEKPKTWTMHQFYHITSGYFKCFCLFCLLVFKSLCTQLIYFSKIFRNHREKNI